MYSFDISFTLYLYIHDISTLLFRFIYIMILLLFCFLLLIYCSMFCMCNHIFPCLAILPFFLVFIKLKKTLVLVLSHNLLHRSTPQRIVFPHQLDIIHNISTSRQTHVVFSKYSMIFYSFLPEVRIKPCGEVEIFLILRYPLSRLFLLT